MPALLTRPRSDSSSYLKDFLTDDFSKKTTVKPTYLDESAFDYFESYTRRFLSELNAVSILGDDWDGYGAAGISANVANNARAVIRGAIDRRVFPEVSPTTAGTIEFEWTRLHYRAVLEVGELTYSAFVTRGEVTEYTAYENVEDSQLLVTLWEKLVEEFSVGAYGKNADKYLPPRN